MNIYNIYLKCNVPIYKMETWFLSSSHRKDKKTTLYSHCDEQCSSHRAICEGGAGRGGEQAGEETGTAG